MTDNRPPTDVPSSTGTPTLVRRHLVVGWLGLLCFLVLGIVLEGLHAFKAPTYLDADNETRRMLWRLAHAHGAILSIIHWGASWTFAWALPRREFGFVKLASRSLTGALIALPLGFFWGGVGAVDGDPGIGIVLVPVGALCLLVSAALLLILALGVPGEAKETDRSQ